MAFAKFDDLWRLMSKYTFNIDSDSLEGNLNCTICKNIMVDSYQSPCACHYCLKCIHEYLSGESKCCPGDKEECQEEHLMLERNLFRNVVLNRRISKLRVHCPNESCPYTEELIKMEDHLILCTKQPLDCPYLVLGCNNKGGSKDKISTHMYEDLFNHNHLLIENIQNMRNELSNFRDYSKDIENTNREIIRFKEDLKSIKENEIEELKRELFSLKDDFQRCQIEIKSLKEGSLVNEITMIEMKRQMLEQRSKIDGLKNDAERKEMEIEVMRGELVRMRETQRKTMIEVVEDVKKEIEKMDVIEDQKKSMDDLRENLENIGREIPFVIKQVKDAQIFDERREFMWRVDNFSKMKDDLPRETILWRYSYKFDLAVRCNGDNFGLFCYILGGEFDHGSLAFPMKRKIKLSLINQNTMEVHKCEEYRYDTFENKGAFDKARWGWNLSCIGDYSFTSVKDIKDSPGVLLHDSLLISFSIDNE